MNEIDVFSGMDIYLLDQLMKSSIDKRMKILDAGCGEGRNLVYFLRNDFNVDGIDPKEDCIQRLKERFPERKESFIIFSKTMDCKIKAYFTDKKV